MRPGPDRHGLVIGADHQPPGRLRNDRQVLDRKIAVAGQHRIQLGHLGGHHQPHQLLPLAAERGARRDDQPAGDLVDAAGHEHGAAAGLARRGQGRLEDRRVVGLAVAGGPELADIEGGRRRGGPPLHRHGQRRPKAFGSTDPVVDPKLIGPRLNRRQQATHAVRRRARRQVSAMLSLGCTASL